MTVSNKLIELLSARAEATAILSREERQHALRTFRRMYYSSLKTSGYEKDSATLASAMRKLEFVLGVQIPEINNIKVDDKLD